MTLSIHFIQSQMNDIFISLLWLEKAIFKSEDKTYWTTTMMATTADRSVISPIFWIMAPVFWLSSIASKCLYLQIPGQDHCHCVCTFVDNFAAKIATFLSSKGCCLSDVTVLWAQDFCHKIKGAYLRCKSSYLGDAGWSLLVVNRLRWRPMWCWLGWESKSIDDPRAVTRVWLRD